MTFKKATKAQLKLRMALSGPAGSGKTFTALTLAKWLANGQPVAVIDTERGSASKYADLFEFDVLELDSFHPKTYVDAINEAVAGGYAVVVIDSLSHAWSGKGGILEIVQRKGNSFQAWGEVKPIEAALIEAVTGARIHVIATMRSKTEYVVEKDERSGKSAPRKVGLAPVQRDGMEYEFDVFGELDQENTLLIQKTRCPALTGAVISKPGKPLAETLRAWLAGATTKTPEPPAPAMRPELHPVADEPENAEDEAIPYTLNEDEAPAEPEPERPAEKPYNPKADAQLRQRLNRLGIRTLAEVEVFIAEAEEQGDGAPLRGACFVYLERQEETARKSATPRGNRGPSALAATSEGPVPASLESLDTGTRAS